jgi:hypothetical protein
MIPLPVTIEFDHAQLRLAKDRLAILAQGSYEGTNGRVCGWHPTLWSTIWADPITFTLMLRPYQLTYDWHTTGTGNYARLAKSAFTFATSSKWTEASRDCSGDTWLVADACTNEWALTTSTWDKNRGWFLSWQCSNTGTDRFEELNFGWNSSASGAAGPSVRVWSDGQVEVWKDGAYLGSGSVGGKETQSGTPGQTGANDAGGWMVLFAIPMRKREILFYSPSTGGGFVWVFNDIAEDDADPTITPATKFWFMRPSGSATIQVCPLTFPASGYACSQACYFAYPPEIGRAEGTPTLYYDGAGYGTQTVAGTMVKTDGSTAFAPDGITQAVLAKLALSQTGNSTPFVYGALMGYTPEFAYTDSSEQTSIPLEASETDCVAQNISLSVTERPGDARFSFTVRNWRASAIASIDAQSNRPVLIKVGDQILMDGRAEAPRHTGNANDVLDTLEFEVRDAWASFENYKFNEPVPLDGSTLKSALEFILQTVGFDTDLVDIEDPGYTIPKVSGKCAGEWNTLIEAGDSAADWIERLFESYAGNWFYDIVPTAEGPKFIARSPAGMEQTPSLTLYKTRAEADAWFTGSGYTAQEAMLYGSTLTVDSWKSHPIAPECNEVRVTGQDPRTGKPLQGYARDEDSIDPTAPPSMRPSNWRGELLRYGLGEPSLTDQASVNKCVELLGPRLTSVRYMAEWGGKMLFETDGAPVWKGGCLTVTDEGDYRITALSVDFVKETSLGGTEGNKFLWRPARYMAERIDDPDQPWRGRYSAGDLKTIEGLKRIGIDSGGMRRGAKAIAVQTPSSSAGQVL